MQLGHTSAAPSSAGILRRTAPTIETGRSPDPAPEGQKIRSGGEMRAQRTHETQAERDDHPEEKEGQNEGRARSIPSPHFSQEEMHRAVGCAKIVVQRTI
ncbi:hypothetical protein [Pseudomonas aeruginosa]|uniref:hypothetical protein n=1 Tax=Pseudomonas aeruginosa TaxID=287 RepID=UPI00066A4940|nr:hypothetical protein [Pseudomonas aeruginosa]